MGMKTVSPYLVCFGDSLTAGYQAAPHGFGVIEDAPYGGFIQEWVGGRARIVVSGICGELTSEMVKRFQRDVIQVGPQATVILGGANDLGWGVLPGQICENLREMYRLALAAGIEPVGVTVPSIRADSHEFGIEQPRTAKDSEKPISPWVRAHIDQRLVSDC